MSSDGEPPVKIVPNTYVGGTFVGIVGPSGAGKDTVISGARSNLAGDPRFVFAHRCITRPIDETENSLRLTEAEFAAGVAAGHFLLWWKANGLCYGLPIALEVDLARGRHVVANLSRDMIPDVRARFRRSIIIHVSARPEILAARLASRGREESSAQASRLQRASRPMEAIGADLLIENNSSPADAILALLSLLRALPDLRTPDGTQ